MDKIRIELYRLRIIVDRLVVPKGVRQEYAAIVICGDEFGSDFETRAKIAQSRVDFAEHIASDRATIVREIGAFIEFDRAIVIVDGFAEFFEETISVPSKFVSFPEIFVELNRGLRFLQSQIITFVREPDLADADSRFRGVWIELCGAAPVPPS